MKQAAQLPTGATAAPDPWAAWRSTDRGLRRRPPHATRKPSVCWGLGATGAAIAGNGHGGNEPRPANPALAVIAAKREAERDDTPRSLTP